MRSFALLRMILRFWGAVPFFLLQNLKNTQKCKIFFVFLCSYEKKLYLCIAFETMKAFGRLAQLVQSICLTSRGSAVRIRQRPQNLENFIEQKASRSHDFGRLAQLVQSICLTSRGSAVRIRQRPHRSPLKSGLFLLSSNSRRESA